MMKPRTTRAKRLPAATAALAAALLGACSGLPLVRDVPLVEPRDVRIPAAPGDAASSPQFARDVGGLLGPVLPGNRFETLVDGDRIFPAMLDAIRGARVSVTFETFVYWEGRIASEFAHALAERARAGVPVKVVIDWFGGSSMAAADRDEMEGAGVDLRIYHPIAWFSRDRWGRIADVENRTHRKILVVDGRIGFVGGVGIADEWLGHSESPEHWRDTHFRVEGPVVGQLQFVFLDNWLESGGELLRGERYFPELQAAGGAAAQAFRGAPTEATANIELLTRMSIATAVRSIKLESAYFVPDDSIVDALVEAAARGVAVEIIVPGEQKTDSPLVGAVSPERWGHLLEHGVRIWEFQPTMLHCKILVIDDAFALIGSTNFDNRSFRLNDEIGVNVFDADFSREQAGLFEADKARSRLVTLEEWKKRPWIRRSWGSVAAFFWREL